MALEIVIVILLLAIGGGVGMNYSCSIMENKIGANVCYLNEAHEEGAENRELVKELKERSKYKG
jgi:hypothetical protein